MSWKTHINDTTQNEPGQVTTLQTAVLSEGVHDLIRGDFKVTGTAGMAVDVAKGEAFVNNDSYVYGSMDQRMFSTANSASTSNVTIASNSSGNARIDSVCIKIDTAITPGIQGVTASSIIVVQGTASASPVAPTIPNNYLLLANIAVANGASVISNAEITDKRVQASLGMISAPNGFLVNGKIVPSVSSNNLTVALKTMAGNDPSAGEPIWVRIDNKLIKITSALSVTKNAGTNWFASGSSEWATNEIDYFVYLAWDSTNSLVRIGFARISFASIYSDFSGTSTNEKYGAFDTAPGASNVVEVIGRFAATLSAGAGYTWTVPTFTNINLKQKPIYDTRPMTFVPSSYGPQGGGTFTSTVLNYSKVQIKGDKARWSLSVTGTISGTVNEFRIGVPPFQPSASAGSEDGVGNIASIISFIQINSSFFQLFRYDAGAFATGASKTLVFSIEYFIN